MLCSKPGWVQSSALAARSGGAGKTLGSDPWGEGWEEIAAAGRPGLQLWEGMEVFTAISSRKLRLTKQEPDIHQTFFFFWKILACGLSRVPAACPAPRVVLPSSCDQFGLTPEQWLLQCRALAVFSVATRRGRGFARSMESCWSNCSS